MCWPTLVDMTQPSARRSDATDMKSVTKRELTPYTKGFVTSADGTRIGYRQLGSGPAVLLLHGGVNASQHLMRLGSALARAFTVYIPDRRGRGLSGPIGADYSFRAEDEDLAALVERTGARNLFGVADGALFVLHGALGLPSIEKVAAYEPLVFLGQPGLENFLDLIHQFDQELAEGKLGHAVVTAAMSGSRHCPPHLGQISR